MIEQDVLRLSSFHLALIVNLLSPDRSDFKRLSQVMHFNPGETPPEIRGMCAWIGAADTPPPPSPPLVKVNMSVLLLHISLDLKISICLCVLHYRRVGTSHCHSNHGQQSATLD